MEGFFEGSQGEVPREAGYVDAFVDYGHVDVDPDDELEYVGKGSDPLGGGVIREESLAGGGP